MQLAAAALELVAALTVAQAWDGQGCSRTSGDGTAPRMSCAPWLGGGDVSLPRPGPAEVSELVVLGAGRHSSHAAQAHPDQTSPVMLARRAFARVARSQPLARHLNVLVGWGSHSGTATFLADQLADDISSAGMQAKAVDQREITLDTISQVRTPPMRLLRCPCGSAIACKSAPW